VTQAELLLDLLNDAVAVAFPIAILFPLIGLPKIGFWPWYQSSWGWNLVIFDLVVAIAVLPSWLHRVLGMNPETLYFEWILVVSLWSIPIIVLWRTFLIWRAQRNIETRRGEEEEHADSRFQ